MYGIENDADVMAICRFIIESGGGQSEIVLGFTKTYGEEKRLMYRCNIYIYITTGIFNVRRTMSDNHSMTA